MVHAQRLYIAPSRKMELTVQNSLFFVIAPNITLMHILNPIVPIRSTLIRLFSEGAIFALIKVMHVPSRAHVESYVETQ
jgi:hypothetical protein